MPRRSKFGNVHTAYKGRMFDSKKESQHAALLDTLRKASNPKDRVVSVEYQYRIPLIIGAVKIADYIADFRVKYADGRVEIQDTKGFQTDVYRLKKKLVFALHGIHIIEN